MVMAVMVIVMMVVIGDGDGDGDGSTLARCSFSISGSILVTTFLIDAEVGMGLR